MGLYAFELKKLKEISDLLPKPFTALSFGHPDILATQKELEFIAPNLPLDNKEVIESRGGHPSPKVVGNAKPVFKAMGADLVVAEFRELYNVDYMIDLNQPGEWRKLPPAMLVVDAGTSEHCFNVGVALINMAQCVEVGGYIYHMPPLCNLNHGFWNFSPCVFNDFYTQNGFEIVELKAQHKGELTDVPPRKGAEFGKWIYRNDGRKHTLMCIAKRVTKQEIVSPRQYKYM